MPDTRRIITLTAPENADGITVGGLLKMNGFSRGLTAKLKRRENGITMDGLPARTCDRVKAGGSVCVLLEDEPESAPEPNGSLSVPVLYEDEDAVIFDKPAGMPVHPSVNHHGDTLGNFFAYAYPGLTFRPVNRLDRNTSGLCAAAKNARAAGLMQKTLKKTYYAAVCGKPAAHGRIDASVGRADGSVIKREVRPDGKPAATEYSVIYSAGKYSLLRVTLLTGRTHQIRVHMAYIGCPLAGDDLYGGDTSDIQRHALHCGELSFVSPATGETVSVKSPLREDIMSLFDDNNKLQPCNAL